MQELGVSHDLTATDNRDSFLAASGGEGSHGGDGREQLPAEASNTEGVSKDLLFFEELIQPLESV
jgi:hypothetical protein